MSLYDLGIFLMALISFVSFWIGYIVGKLSEKQS
jgi:hypothetical protein